MNTIKNKYVSFRFRSSALGIGQPFATWHYSRGFGHLGLVSSRFDVPVSLAAVSVVS